MIENPDIMVCISKRRNAREKFEELESRLETVEFDEWIAELTVEQRTPGWFQLDFAKPGSPGHNVQLKQYFREKVWSERRESVLRSHQ